MIELIKSAVRRLLPRNAFARGVSVLVGGTAGAQLLAVAAAPLLTRLFSPEDFGLLAVYASLLALIGVVSSLRYELAIPLPEDDVEAANVAVLSLLLVGLSTVLTGVLVGLSAESIAGVLGVPALAGYLWLLPVGVLVAGGYSVFNYWAVRTKRFSTIAGTRVRQSLATLIIQLVAFKLGGLALLLGQVAGQGVGTTSLARPALAMPAFRKVSWGGIKKTVLTYKQFPLFSTLSGFTNTLSRQLPVILLAAFFSPAVVGFYSLTNRVLLLPMSFVGTSVSQVVFGSASTALRNSKERLLFLETFKLLAILSSPLLLLIIFYAPKLFYFAFGEKWIDSGYFAQWMSAWFFLQFISSPLSSVITAKMLENVAFYWHFCLLSLRGVALWVGSLTGDLTLTIQLFSGVSAASYFAYLLWIGHLCSVTWFEVVSVLFRVIIKAFIYLLPFFVFSFYLTEDGAGFFFGFPLLILFLLKYYWSSYSTLSFPELR